MVYIKKMKEIINTSIAPAPIGPYSQGVVAGNIVFVSGQIALDAVTGNLVLDDIMAETKQVMENIKSILSEIKLDFNNVVKSSIFLMDMKDFSAVNDVYGSYFSHDYPARETIQVAGLPKGVNVEISVIATKP